jgi:hypothetical protein
MRRFCRSQGCCICSCLVGGTRFRPCFLFKMWSRTVMLLTCVYLRVISIKLIFFNIWRNSLFNRFVRWCSESTVILVVVIHIGHARQQHSPGSVQNPTLLKQNSHFSLSTTSNCVTREKLSKC